VVQEILLNANPRMPDKAGEADGHQSIMRVAIYAGLLRQYIGAT